MLTHARVSWHVILAAVIAALLIAALPQATDAATKRQRCIAAAEKALGRDIRASDYRIVLGTNTADEKIRTSPRQDLICGFGGTEWIRGTIKAGDIFISGAGTSYVSRQVGGLVVGGPDIDMIEYMSGGRFYGRRGDLLPGMNLEMPEIAPLLQDARGDAVGEMHGGLFRGGPGHDMVANLYDGRFAGGRGFDSVLFQRGGIYLGQRGNDRVRFLYGGRFKGGSGNDRVRAGMSGGVFNGGPGTDTVEGYEAGKLFSVEVCRPAKACP